MKFIKTFFTGLVVCGVALVAFTAGAADGTIPTKVVRIKGSAQYTTDNHTWQPLKMNQVVKPGTVIQTGEGSLVDLILGEGDVDPNPTPMNNAVNFNPHPEQNLVRIWENSILGIDKLTQTKTGADTMTDTQLDLRAGQVFGTVTKLSATSKYEVKVPNGVAGIRGTIYSVSAVGVIGVYQGSVMVAYMDASGNPVTKEVGRGYELDTRTGDIKPLSQLKLGEFLRLAWEARIFINHPTEVMVDHTVYDVSPVHGNGNNQPPPP